MPAQPLQHDEGDHREGDVTGQGLINPTPARRQAAELLGIAEEGLDGPTASFAQHDGGQVGAALVAAPYFGRQSRKATGIRQKPRHHNRTTT